jgi:hypothetical protein
MNTIDRGRDSRGLEHTSSILCAPQQNVSSKSPFNIKTKITNDNGERAASEEQGGSSQRSGSNYLGDGFINIS